MVRWEVVAAASIFVALLLAACVTDIRSRRIPNKLVLVLLLCGFVSSLVFRPTMLTLVWATASLLLGFAIWIPFYLLRMLGAGDVKLFAAASVWLTPVAVAEAALASALIGGALAIVWLVRAHGLRFTVVRLSHAVQQPRILRDPVPTDSRDRRVPYGVAMAAGLIVTALRMYAPAFH
jgi:prepilin peptidase CpaA